MKPVSLQAGEKTGFSQPQEAAYSSPFLSQLGQEADPQGFIASGPSGKMRRLRSVSSEECRRRQWELAAGPALKLEIQQKVWYRVRQPQLLEAGLSPGVNPRFLQLIVGGEEEPLLVLGEEDDRFDAWDAVEFYGTGADTPWTGTRTYWLVEGEEPGKRVVGEGWSGIGSSEEPQSFSFTIEQKKRVIYAPTLKNGQQEKLFGPMIGSQPVDQVLYLHHFDRSQPEAQLEVSLQGATRKPHRVSIRVNGLELGETSFLGQQLQGATFAVPQSWLEEGNNIVTLIAQGGPTDVSLLEAIRLTYRHTYRADFDTLEFTVGKVGTDLGETDRETQPEGPSPLGEIRDSHRISSARNLVTVPNFSPTIGGFSSPWIRVVEVTDAKRPRMRAGFVHRQGEGYAITLSTPDSGPGRLLAFAESKVKQPAAIRADSPSAWHRADSGAEVVILTHRSFLDSVEPLKTLREARGYSVVVIDIEDVYDEFAFGAKTPWALKDFLTWATRQWLTPPRFVLLVGDATFDPRNHLGLGNFDFVPTRLVETELMETASDDWFVDFDLDEVPDLAIGRLPVRTAWEAERLVRKILAYEQEPGGEWRNRALIVADAPDPFSDFDKKGDALKATLPGQLALDEIYARQGEDAARTELLTKLNQGQLVVGYLGHGSVEMWSQDGLLTSRDARALTNGSRLPFLVSLTCLNGYFHHPYTESLAEALLKSRDGGALAVWASSALTPLEGQLALAQELFRLLFGGEALTLGEAVARAKAAFPDSGFSRSSDIRRS